MSSVIESFGRSRARYFIFSKLSEHEMLAAQGSGSRISHWVVGGRWDSWVPKSGTPYAPAFTHTLPVHGLWLMTGLGFKI